MEGKSVHLLRYVYVGDLFVNAELVRLGCAYAFRLPPDTKQAVLFDKLERQAARQRAGMWKA